jgi:phosphatidylglycerophosphatase A
MNWFFLTVGYSGLLPKAPGTFGSIVALIPGLLILSYFGAQTLFLAALLATLAGIKVVNRYEKSGGLHDDKRIVIDELAGMWIALSIAPGMLFTYEELFVFENGLMLQILLSFVFFRFFDIKKPSVIGRIDREAKGGISVMGDDVIAGFAAGIASAIVWEGLAAVLAMSR